MFKEPTPAFNSRVWLPVPESGVRVPAPVVAPVTAQICSTLGNDPDADKMLMLTADSRVHSPLRAKRSFFPLPFPAPFRTWPRNASAVVGSLSKIDAAAWEFRMASFAEVFLRCTISRRNTFDNSLRAVLFRFLS